VSVPDARPAPLDRRDLLLLGGLLLLALAVRAAFVSLTDVPPFDPWRHLALIRNLREGAGFTLFGGQPYLWYGPAWYVLCAALPAAVGPQWVAAAFSALAVPLVYLLLRRGGGANRSAGLVGAGLAALGGPWVAYTCHYGPEGLALFLALAALLVALDGRGGRPAALAAGLAFGAALVLRTNLAFLCPLFLPAFRSPGRAGALIGGGVVPLLATWWRNHAIIGAHEYVFTWDGLATPSAGFNPLSTLIVQLHPDVGAGLRRLHELIIPVPEWIRRPDGIAWHLILFMLCGVAGLVLARRFTLLLSAGLALGYFLLLDRSLSAHFFRIYLPLFPLFCLALGEAAGAGAPRRRTGRVLAALLLLAGLPLLRPSSSPGLGVATPPEELLVEDAFMVNSGFYHPESLVWRFPDKRFVGMPLGPEEFERFRALHPDYRAILWHDFSVQDDLAQYLKTSGNYEVVRSGLNAAGRRYTVILPRRQP